jgi:hypothetical protein
MQLMKYAMACTCGRRANEMPHAPAMPTQEQSTPPSAGSCPSPCCHARRLFACTYTPLCCQASKIVRSAAGGCCHKQHLHSHCPSAGPKCNEIAPPACCHEVLQGRSYFNMFGHSKNGACSCATSAGDSCFQCTACCCCCCCCPARLQPPPTDASIRTMQPPPTAHTDTSHPRSVGACALQMSSPANQHPPLARQACMPAAQAASRGTWTPPPNTHTGASHCGQAPVGKGQRGHHPKAEQPRPSSTHKSAM